MQLHPYQRRAVGHLRAHPRAALFMDMGLGKTATVLMSLGPSDLPVLVVAPKRVAEQVWPAQAQMWRPDLSLSLAQGGLQARERALRAGADITVVGRDNTHTIPVDLHDKYQTVVIDELSGYKTRATRRWKSVRALTLTTPRVVGLTGTPAPNGLIDLWAQVALLDGGQRLGRSLTAYRERWFRPGRVLPTGTVCEWIPRENAGEQISAAINDLALSMSARDYLPDLPRIRVNRLDVDLPPAIRRLYARLRADMTVDLSLVNGAALTSATAGALSNRLCQLSAGFVYPDADSPDPEGVVRPDGERAYLEMHRAKLDALGEVLAGTGSPVLCFYRYRAEADMIRRCFPQARTLDEVGVVAQWDAGRVPLLLAHPASAGHGLNLQAGGHTIVWTSLPWSLEEWEQANARLARQGQTHPVVAHVLLTRGAPDATILGALEAKRDVQAALLADLAGDFVGVVG